MTTRKSPAMATFALNELITAHYTRTGVDFTLLSLLHVACIVVSTSSVMAPLRWAWRLTVILTITPASASRMLVIVLSAICVICAVCIARTSEMVNTFSLLRFNLCEITSRHNNDQHQDNENDHDIKAKLAAYLNLVRDTASVRAFATKTLSFTLALVEVLFHSLFADACTPCAVSERAAWFIWAIYVSRACLDTFHDRRAHISWATAR